MIILDLFDTHHEKALKEGAVGADESMGYGGLAGEELDEYIQRRRDTNYSEFPAGTRVTHAMMGDHVGKVVDAKNIPIEDRRDSGVPVQFGNRIYWMSPSGLKNMQLDVAEGSLNELSKNALKSYSRERGTTIHQDQRDADRARDTAADKKKHGNTKAAADWEDEASWLDKRAEKGAKGVAQAAIKIAKKGMAEDSVEEGWKGALAGAALAGLGALSGAPAQAADLSNFNTQ